MLIHFWSLLLCYLTEHSRENICVILLRSHTGHTRVHERMHAPPPPPPHTHTHPHYNIAVLIASFEKQ